MKDTHAETRQLAYRIAIALQGKFVGKLVGLRTESLPIADRLVFEYTLTEGGTTQSCTAYSEGYFEDQDKAHVTWLAQQIYTQLKDRLQWLLRGPTNAYAADVSDRTERPKRTKVPATGVVQNRRNTGTTGTRKVTQPEDASHTKPVHAEDVPAGLF